MLCDVTSTMFVHLALLHAVACLDIQVEGDLAFDLRVPNILKQRWCRVGWETGNQCFKQLVFKIMRVQNVTSPDVKCVYRYPEKEQADALLSNMMNELTKVFVRANDVINDSEMRRKASREARQGNLDLNSMVELLEKMTHKEAITKLPKRANKRFKVVHKKQKPFFELIYSNMIEEYRNFYNNKTEQVYRADRDPCSHQAEVKQIWRELLQHALTTLSSAAERYVDEYLRDQQVEPEHQVRKRLSEYLTSELGKVRASQLQMLCDTYHLCFNDL